MFEELCRYTGAMPQTWEQPSHAWEGLDGHAGDNDPVDVVDVSKTAVTSGTVIKVCQSINCQRFRC